MDGFKEQHHNRLHAKDLKKKQKHREANNPAGNKQDVLPPVPPQPVRPQSPDEEQQDDRNYGEDFTKLLSQTASGGLILKAERDWNNHFTCGSEQFAHYFDQDVQLLAENICKIPFHERFDLHDVPISEGLREKFISEAAKMGDLIVNDSPASIVVAEGIRAHHSQMPLQIRPSVDKSEPVLDPKEDIQGWLDNVLDI